MDTWDASIFWLDLIPFLMFCTPSTFVPPQRWDTQTFNYVPGGGAQSQVGTDTVAW